MTTSNDERELKAWADSRADIAAGRVETMSPAAHLDRLDEMAKSSDDLLADTEPMIEESRRQTAAPDAS
jgi:hypothetical protein